MPKHRITLEPRPCRMAMMETKMRYAVMLDGKEFSELYYNMRGYRGVVPHVYADGRIGRFDLGEASLADFKREIARSNKDLRALNATA